MPGQKRSVHVDRPVLREVQDRSRKDAPKGRDDGEARSKRAQRPGKLWILHLGRLKHGNAMGFGDPLRFGWYDLHPTAARTIRLAHETDDWVVTVEEGFENGARERRRAHEDDAPSGQMRCRFARDGAGEPPCRPCFCCRFR